MFVFLFCSERSGSNFITSLMGGHSKISGAPPSHLFRLFGLNEHKYLPTSNDENWLNFTTDFIDSTKCMIGEWDTEITLDRLSSACPNRQISEALAYLYRVERRSSESISFVKENHTYKIVPFILSNWPKSKFVHQIRDPRDVVASWLKTSDAKGGVVEAVETWLTDQTRTRRVIKEQNIDDQVISIRYEDVITNAELAVHNLCNHIGVNFESDMFEFYKDSRVRRNAKRVPAWENLSKPILTNNSGNYVSTLTKIDIRYIELSCHRLMTKFGYEFETDANHLAEAQIKTEIRLLKNKVSRKRVARIVKSETNDVRNQRLKVINRVKSRQSTTMQDR